MADKYLGGDIPVGIVTRIDAIIDYLWEKECEDYMQQNDCSDTRAIEFCRERPDDSHIFAYLVAVSDWLSEQTRDS